MLPCCLCADGDAVSGGLPIADRWQEVYQRDAAASRYKNALDDNVGLDEAACNWPVGVAHMLLRPLGNIVSRWPYRWLHYGNRVRSERVGDSGELVLVTVFASVK